MTLAQVTTADAPSTYQFDWAWLDTLRDQPGVAAAAAACLAVVVGLTAWLYWRERHSLSRPTLFVLMAFRAVAIVGVVVMLLGPQRRRVEQVVRPSRVVVLVDTSVSMAMADSIDPSAAEVATRADAAQRLLVEDKLIKRLAATHEVTVAGSDSVAKAAVFTGADAATQADVITTAAETDLRERLRPVSPETRLGDAIRAALDQNAGEPLAGIVLLSDGRNNAGRPPVSTAAEVAEAGARLLTVGFGPDRVGANLIVRELVAPTKAYPNDEVELTAVVEATGDGVGDTTLSLYRRRESEDANSAVLLDTKPISPASEPGPQSVAFVVTPEAAGRYVYSVRAAPVANETRTDDNEREATVEVVDRITNVLLWAGGPGRDYRFLRNQLRRDESFVVDVLLQSASNAASQDAREVLLEFPTSLKALNEYDVIVAFDPDWAVLAEPQVELVEEWVARRGGGLLYAPGAVNMPKWLQRDPSPAIASLLPVDLPDRLALLSPLQSSATTRPRPVRLTRAGADAGFMWIAGTKEASRDAWRDFNGFYRVNPTPAIRPGATVFAESDPSAGGGVSVVFAEQFYGAGRVFYSGSSELWRLRQGQPKHFATLTTKLLRRLAQGRLLSNSPGGSLLFERGRYDIGATMVLRALTPDRELPGDTPRETLRAQLVDPGGTATTIALTASQSQRGAWTTRLAAEREGSYEAILALGDGPPLTARVEVTVPEAERKHATRDDRLLEQVAAAGGGWHYLTREATLTGAGDVPPLPNALPSREETRMLYGQPDEQFARRVSQSLMAVICGALLLEWFTRRVSRLA